MVWAVSLLTTDLITRSLTPRLCSAAIRSLTGFGNRYSPYPDQCSTACAYCLRLALKAISRRTSYLCVRLEFHPYAQLIRTFFNMSRFDPPRNFTCVSIWPCVDHCSFGSAYTDFPPSSDSVSLRLRIFCLTSPAHATRWLILQ